MKKNTTDQSWFERLSQLLLREPQDREQLVSLLREAQQRQLLDADVLAMIEGALQVSDMRVRDIMVPRSQMVVIGRDEPLDDILPRVIDSAHSRFPVVGESQSEVIGVLLAKDLLNYCLAVQQQNPFNLRSLLRKPVFVPESKRLNNLLSEFRSTRNHMAIVADEYGMAAGLVTIEDVLEQIVGDIEDEHDVVDSDWIVSHHDHFKVKGLTPLTDFNEQVGAHLKADDCDTVSGLVVKNLGHLPERDEVITIENWQFKVLRAGSRRVHLLEARRIASSNEDSELNEWGQSSDSGC